MSGCHKQDVTLHLAFLFLSIHPYLTLKTTVFPGYVSTSASTTPPSAADATKDLTSFPPFLLSLRSPKANSKVLPAPTTTCRRAAAFAVGACRRVCFSAADCCRAEGEGGAVVVGRLASPRDTSCLPPGDTAIIVVLGVHAALLLHAAAEGRSARGEAGRQVKASKPGKHTTSSSASKDTRGNETWRDRRDDDDDDRLPILLLLLRLLRHVAVVAVAAPDDADDDGAVEGEEGMAAGCDLPT